MDLFKARSLPFLTRRNYVYEMSHLIPWSVLAGLVEGQFGAIVVTKTFDGSALQIAIAAATPIAAMIFSMFWGIFCQGRPKVRLISTISLGVALFAGTVGVIPANEIGAIWFIVQMGAAQILLAGTITVRAAIWKSNYPRMERGRITARLQGVREVVMVSASMAAAALCDRDAQSYAYIYPTAALCGMIGIFLLSRLHIRGERGELARLTPTEGQGDIPRGARLSPREVLSPRLVGGSVWRVLRDNRRFTRYLVAQLCIGVGNQLTIAVIALLVAREMDIGDIRSYWISTALIVALPKLLLFGTIVRWGRLFDRVGVVRFRVINVYCWLGSLGFGLAGALVLEYSDWLGGTFIIWAVSCFAARGICFGLGMGGGKLAWNLGHLHFAPREEAELYMGIHVSLTGLRGLIAPLAGMLLWGLIGWWVWIIALSIALVSLWMFISLAREERPLDRS